MEQTPTDGANGRPTVRYKKLDQRAVVPAYGTAGSAGFDLATLDEVHIGPGETTLARTGLVIATPPGHMMMLAPRSSTWKRWGVRLGNSVAVVDSDYCGDEDELSLSLWRPRDSPRGNHWVPIKIPAGTRVAQGVFVPVLTSQFIEVEAMGASRGGWGSTG